MTIISDSHKFIFVKPVKTAGSSVQANLAKVCAKTDLISAMDHFDPTRDETRYSNKNAVYSLPEHYPSFRIKKNYPDKWGKYWKVSIVRNPWDAEISKYYHRRHLYHLDPATKKLGRPNKFVENYDEPKSFSEYMEVHHRTNWSSCDPYYFINGKMVMDFVLRYENLESDYKKLCKILEIPHQPLPKLKTKIRKEKLDYTKYYEDPKLILKVGAASFKTIQHFGYKFGD